MGGMRNSRASPGLCGLKKMVKIGVGAVRGNVTVYRPSCQSAPVLTVDSFLCCPVIYLDEEDGVDGRIARDGGVL